jgi:transcriptional regulator GlxA family with amidase domain
MSKPTSAGPSRSKRSRRSGVERNSRDRSDPPPRGARGIRIGFLGFDGVAALDLVGPADAFATANEVWQARYGGPAPYRLTVLGLAGRRFAAESGLRFEADAPLDQAPPLDTFIVPGGSGLREPRANARIAAWLRAHARQCRRIASICTGIYGVAPSGLPL